MSGPKNASQSADGFRFYEWAEPGKEPVKVLSVTSIKKLAGESFQLVTWQINNVINVAMGTTKRTTYGPRGGKKDTYVKDGEFPGTFVQKLLATEGEQAGLDEMRKWLRETAERPRDTAAVRGTIVHEAIELGMKLDRIDREYVEAAVARTSASDQKKIKKAGGVQDEDVEFVGRAVANYWDMRVNVPFIILAREVQVWNLSAGYGGQADALIWFLGDWVDGEFVALPLTTEEIIALAKRAKLGQITQHDIEEIGGHVTLADWKSGSGPYTDQAVQVTAYLGAEFIGTDGVIDERLTEIIVAAQKAAIIFVRPEGWAVYFLDWNPAIMYAFLGSVAYARFLAANKEPHTLFTHSVKGVAEWSPRT